MSLPKWLFVSLLAVFSEVVCLQAGSVLTREGHLGLALALLVPSLLCSGVLGWGIGEISSRMHDRRA